MLAATIIDLVRLAFGTFFIEICINGFIERSILQNDRHYLEQRFSQRSRATFGYTAGLNVYDSRLVRRSIDVNDGTQYYFVKNLQGDVVQIRSIYGTVVVEYAYDAWGNVLSITGMYADTLGVNNPIRYRGYYQDFETGFYYLQSRYYDPAIRRFINADGYINANGDILGFNMYAYCGNNPIMYVDPTGEFSWGKLVAIISVAAVITTAVVATIATCGIASVAGTIAVTSAITVAAKTTEVAVLQGKKSKQDGDSFVDTVDDIVNSIYDNADKELGSILLTKTAGYAGGFYSQSIPFQESLDVMRAEGFSFKGFVTSAGGEIIDRFSINGLKYYMSSPASKSSMAVSYAFAAYSVGNTVYSWFVKDPVKRAMQQGYSLR